MLEPLSAAQWNETTSAHLLYRAGFGGCPQDVSRIQSLGMDRAVSWFVDYDKTPDDTPAPDWAHPDPAFQARREAIRNASDPAMKKELQRQERTAEFKQMVDLRYWWVRRMALGPRPLQEKMTLFWHSHFATSFEKVRLPYFLWQQNEIFRRHALGYFPELLTAVAKDPAMLVYLDGANSRKGHPNENFAREVMELFTLGEGHYTEKDIQESARAYTGWGLGKDRQSFQYYPYNHDNGVKTFFGQTGNFTGEDCLRIICDQPQTANYLCWKLWKYFAQDNPPAAIVDALAAQFQASQYDLRQLVRTILTAQEFYAPDVIRGQIKSPVMWLIGAVREIQGTMPTMPMALVMLHSLGQELFQPPNVKGWDGGPTWITTTSLLDRYNFAAALVEGERVSIAGLTNQMKGMMHQLEDQGLLQIAPAEVTSLFTSEELSTPDFLLNAMQTRFLHAPMAAARFDKLTDFVRSKSPLSEVDLRKAIRLMMSTPDYQLC